MSKVRNLTYPVLKEVKGMFNKSIGKPLSDDDRARAAKFDVAKELEKAIAIRKT